MRTIEQYIKDVNLAISNIDYPANPPRLYDPIKYTMADGGKRIRPLLTLMCNNALGGTGDTAMAQAIGIEMFHNFTLLHDDVMDNSDTRRGKPTVHIKWDQNVAILSGDVMLTMATKLISDSKDKHIRAILELFNQTAIEIYEGQQFDVDFEERNDVRVEEYLNMIRLKTSVLIGCACKLGAIVADSNAEDASNLYEFGMNLGVAFQLQDDYLDVYGDEGFGKPIGGDILNNKKTYMLITALANAQGDKLEELNQWIANNNAVDAKAKIKGVTELYNQLNVPTACEQQIAEYSALALKALDKVNISDDYRTLFNELVQMLMHRSK
ncbi:MAG: polyprenyl synthetase family protein [Bacteroidales bacterium]